MYECFLHDRFIVPQTTRCGGANPIDQASEKQYDKPAKAQSGIVAFSRRKEAVCQWNSIKHKKSKFREYF